MRIPLTLLGTLLLFLTIPASAQLKLSGQQKAELELLCKTHLKPIPDLEWKDFCGCVAESMSELKESDYVTWKDAVSRRIQIPENPRINQMHRTCIAAVRPLPPGTTVIIPGTNRQK